MTWLWMCIAGELVTAGLLVARGEQAQAAVALTLALWMIRNVGLRTRR
jgi:hypothetical protein